MVLRANLGSERREEGDERHARKTWRTHPDGDGIFAAFCGLSFDMRGYTYERLVRFTTKELGANDRTRRLEGVAHQEKPPVLMIDNSC